jgi:hypothetical protein
LNVFSNVTNLFDNKNSINTSKASFLSQKAVIIQIVEDSRALIKTTWPESKLYFPPTEMFLESVLGHNVVEYGMPKLYIKWDSSESYRMYGLFGYNDRIPLEILSAVLSDSVIDSEKPSENLKVQSDSVAARKASVISHKVRKQSNVKRLSVASKTIPLATEKKLRKMDVATYFISQLYLSASLCCDRNYVSIQVLEKFYSYSNLVCMLNTKSLSNEIKAPVCRLLLSLYIDREPQV